MPAPEREVLAMRTAAVATRLPHLRALRLGGPGALDLADALTSSRLFIRENQIIQTLMLDSSARVFADAFVGQDEDSLIVLAEGPTADGLRAHVEAVRRERLPESEVAVDDLLDGREIWGLDGPYAWEIASALLGPEVLGAPYLSFLHLGEVTCFRAGRTGEYGYLLLVPAAQARPLWTRLFELGAPQGLVEGSLAALDQCALENWHFFMRALDAEPDLTPLELQLQWRVDYAKDFAGAAALRERRRAPAGRVTCAVADRPVRPRDPVLLDARQVGSVIASGYSSVLQRWVAWALLRRELSWPGICFEAATAEGLVALQTRSAPLINNRSLFVDPHRHSHQTRGSDAFPPLVTP
ncbi:MAG TPA: glycine cleavage T C-terminal barrel domain-containing protein [Myxococcales bacterium]|nr:glycine cleavage T C-terminal barrel domain-containing protein [Myxococcales bacterium]